MRKSIEISLLMTGLCLWTIGASAQSRPYVVQSFKCHTDSEPGRWYEFTLEIYDASEIPEPKVTRLNSFVEDPLGNRYGEINYSSTASTTFPKISGTSGEASVEIIMGNPVVQIWDIREATVKETMSGGEEVYTAEATCLFIGARP